MFAHEIEKYENCEIIRKDLLKVKLNLHVTCDMKIEPFSTEFSAKNGKNLVVKRL